MKVNKAVNKRTQRNARQTPSSASSARVNAAKDKARRFGLRLQGSVRECVVVVLLALCVFLLLALFSYHPADPGWSYQGPETDVRNWMGHVGAWLADVLYSLLGASALWWPGMFGFAAWWLIRSRQVRFELDPVSIAVHAGGLVLLMFGTTMLGALHFYHPNSILPYASGGILGEGLVAALKPLVGSGGVGLIAAALILSGFPLFSGMSWLQVADEVGKRICRLGGWLSARRQSRRMRAAQRAAAKPTPAAKPQVKTSAEPQVSPQVEPPVAPKPAPAEAKPTVESVGRSAGGRERREPGFSVPLSNSSTDTAASNVAGSETTDTSIPWEAAAFSSNKHVPEKTAVAAAAASTTAVSAAAPKAGEETQYKSPQIVEPKAPRENAFVQAEADAPVEKPAKEHDAFPLRASRQEDTPVPAATNFFVKDEASADPNEEDPSVEAKSV
ncbi:MAG: DNA translocase FtsK 4TM domain-containing protein, partial [Gammaproteobacteria bacterium]|nr:DNA translocase FtsK 4TM domain-containing protein [Gammaproteobacteria bacterium]